jgi:hypothetical protein
MVAWLQTGVTDRVRPDLGLTVDRAIKASGLSAAEVVSVPPGDILRMALKER